MRSSASLISRALKASPSTTWNCRRITRSSVRVLPEMSMRSMKTRSPSTSWKLMSTVRSAAFLVTCGRISTKA